MFALTNLCFYKVDQIGPSLFCQSPWRVFSVSASVVPPKKRIPADSLSVTPVIITDGWRQTNATHTADTHRIPLSRRFPSFQPTPQTILTAAAVAVSKRTELKSQTPDQGT